MDVHIEQVEADISPPSPSADGGASPPSAQPAQVPDADAHRLREQLNHLGRRRERLFAD